jgi:hypothetical protein
MKNNINDLNLKYAYETQPVYSLKEQLGLKSEDDLNSLKSLAGTEDVIKWLTSPENFKMLLTALPAADFDLFSRAAETTFLQDEQLFLPRHASLTAFSLMTPFAVKGTVYCVVPSELKNLWHDLKRLNFSDYKRKRDMIDAYAHACVKLYGALSLDEFVEIFNLESGGKTDKKEAEGYLYELADGEYYRQEEGLLLHALLPLENAQGYIEARQGIPRYLPQHEKMLQFGEGAYYDVFHELEIFRLETEDRLRAADEEGAEQKAYILTDTLYMTLTCELADEEHSELFGEFGLSEDTARIRELKNNVRLWADYGHTPNELFEMIRKGAYKPERNGPCPCGSGKKYKKCHFQTVT